MKFKELREGRGYSLDKLSDLLHINKSTLSRIENGLREPKSSFIEEYANFFNVTIDYLLGNSNIKELTPTKGVKIPVLGSVVAGVPIEAVTDILDYEEIDQEMAKKGEYFALKVKGSSMEPLFCENDVVIVKQQPDVENGEIAVVFVNGGEATLKRIQKIDTGIMLVAENNAVYKPTYYTNNEIQEKPIVVVGKVVELRRKF